MAQHGTELSDAVVLEGEPPEIGPIAGSSLDVPNLETESVQNLADEIAEALSERAMESLSLFDYDAVFDSAETSFQDESDADSSCSSVTTQPEDVAMEELKGSGQDVLSTLDNISEADESRSDSNSNIYRIVPIPGKGMGVVANRFIPRGTLVLTEQPIIQLNRFSPSSSPETQFARLSSVDKERVLSLYNYREDKGTIMGIIWTNAFPLPGSHEDGGLFVKASRINHACNPNTHYSWDEKRRELRAYATRDIDKGEEITSYYISGLARFDKRQTMMQELLGFSCYCWLCSLPEEERAQSDERIAKINKMQPYCRNINQLATTPAMGLGYIRELLHLYDEEFIVDNRPAQALEMAFRIAVRAMDAPRATIFAERSAALFAEVEGEDGRATMDMQKRVVEIRKMMKGDLPLACEGAAFEDWLFGKARTVEDVCKEDEERDRMSAS